MKYPIDLREQNISKVMDFHFSIEILVKLFLILK